MFGTLYRLIFGRDLMDFLSRRYHHPYTAIMIPLTCLFSTQAYMSTFSSSYNEILEASKYSPSLLQLLCVSHTCIYLHLKTPTLLLF